jgi:hypothetical protein
MGGKNVSLVLDLYIDVKYYVPQLPRDYMLLLSNHHRDFVQQIHRLGRVCDPSCGTR